MTNTQLAWLAFGALALAVLVAIAHVRQKRDDATPGPAAASKIELIRQYRAQYGVSLAQAKAAIEAQLGGAPLAAAPQAPGVPSDAASIEGLVRAGRNIEAIKAYRQQTGVGLKEAKDAIDRLRRGF